MVRAAARPCRRPAAALPWRAHKRPTACPSRASSCSRSAGRATRPTSRSGCRASPIAGRRRRNWELTVKRMIGLNHVAVEPAQAREIIKYLADNHGLAPEEAKAGAFEAEHRLVDRTYEADQGNGRRLLVVPLDWPRDERAADKQEWELLLAMHRGYYPLVDNQPMNDGQGFRRNRALPSEPGPDGRPPDARQPMERIVEHLSKTYPLTSAAWTDWAAARQPAGLAGTLGDERLHRRQGPDLRRGRHHRGSAGRRHRSSPSRSTRSRAPARRPFARAAAWSTPGSSGAAARRRPAPSPGARRCSSSARRRDDGPLVRRRLRRARRSTSGWSGIGARSDRPRRQRAGVEDRHVSCRRCGSTARTCRRGSAADQVSLGQGITVTKIVSSTADGVTLAVEVAATAAPGPRDLLVAGAHRASALDRSTTRSTPSASRRRRGWRVSAARSSQAGPAVRGRRVPQRPRRSAEHEGRLEPWPRQRRRLGTWRSTRRRSATTT